jgi:leader peptidase (prepilin peptidase)/N-methyltransferase
MQGYIIVLIVLIFGMCIGSFLNVCIYRLPSSKSIMDPPRSICPKCESLIKCYDNIPVISYLLLTGKCRNCKTPISFRYPIVELISGLFAVCIFLTFGLTLPGLIYYFFISTLIVITFIDIDHRIIPDVITLPGIPVFCLSTFAIHEISFKDSLLGLLAGGGSLYIVGLAYYLLKKKEGMGGGDIKLLAMIGALLGWKGVLFTIFVSSALGTIVGFILILSRKKDMTLAIPFGPFLSIAAISYIFFGEQLIFWYLHL